MFVKHRNGLAIVEVIMVLAISSVLFVIAIGVFNNRRKVNQDDAARLVMAEISKVRNQAQQGEGPKTTAGKAALSTKDEIFGEALLFEESKMTNYKLKLSASGVVQSYESSEIPMPQGLRWNIEASDVCSGFSSCYNSQGPGSDPIYLGNSAEGGGASLLMVFRNRSGESYVFSADKTGTGISLLLAGSQANYDSTRQADLRLAFYSGAASTPSTAADQYYANFRLFIPNEQSLQVVK